jgi:hypothetical protein
MEINGDEYVWEIQKEITKKWTTQVTIQYQNETLIIVPLKEIEKNWIKDISNGKHPIEILKDILKDYTL